MSPSRTLNRTSSVVLLVLPWTLLTGCPITSLPLPGADTIQVELVNDTEFAVQPNIRFDDDSGFFARLAPSERLSTGLIQGGEVLTNVRFDCDELGLIFSDGAEQVIPLFDDYVADSTRILERDEDFDCGDVIEFRFVGEGIDFGVIVSVNGRVVD